uniref:Uncharacterized protein n=1 Tax=Strombidium inclinatum TaxID=197538 RepID=A0A7S3IUS4_9SPIT|mmetsp:Transcript_41844/g.64011  ORF Transcript_41844/g.64011 Transcript_41844/m.64011 type:complete len:157 (+) Transcript_41844:461-931(+)
MKGYQFMMLQQKISMEKMEDPKAQKKEKKQFSRSELIEAFKMSQELQMSQMDEMLKNPDALRDAQNGDNEEAQKKMMHKLLLQQCKSTDTMFQKTNIELEELDDEIKNQKLQDDPEFRQIMQEYVGKMQQKAIQAQMMAGGGGMGGMGGPGMGGMM